MELTDGEATPEARLGARGTAVVTRCGSGCCACDTVTDRGDAGGCSTVGDVRRISDSVSGAIALASASLLVASVADNVTT